MTLHELKQNLKTLCPNCDGSGTIARGVEVARTICDQETGEPLYQVPDIEYEPEQCQWCYEFDIRLDAVISEAVRDHEAGKLKKLTKYEFYKKWEFQVATHRRDEYSADLAALISCEVKAGKTVIKAKAYYQYDTITDIEVNNDDLPENFRLKDIEVVISAPYQEREGI